MGKTKYFPPKTCKDCENDDIGICDCSCHNSVLWIS